MTHRLARSRFLRFYLPIKLILVNKNCGTSNQVQYWYNVTVWYQHLFCNSLNIVEIHLDCCKQNCWFGKRGWNCCSLSFVRHFLQTERVREPVDHLRRPCCCRWNANRVSFYTDHSVQLWVDEIWGKLMWRPCTFLSPAPCLRPYYSPDFSSLRDVKSRSESLVHKILFSLIL